MPLNIGYLTADRTIKGDELFTPVEAVIAIKKYIPDNATIWCPFDLECSSYVKELSKEYNVIHTHIVNGIEEDFFTMEVPQCDIIISNPPFSKKFEVLERLLSIGKPFAIIWPLPGVQSLKHFDLVSQCQLLIFDQRIRFHKELDLSDKPGSPAFASVYLCKDFLPEKLMFEQMS